MHKIAITYFTGETEKEVTSTKKESKKKKKKNAEKESKSNENKIDSQTQNKSFQDNNDNVKLTGLLSDNMCTHKSYKSAGNEFSSLQSLFLNLIFDLHKIIIVLWLLFFFRHWVISISYLCDFMVLYN